VLQECTGIAGVGRSSGRRWLERARDPPVKQPLLVLQGRAGSSARGCWDVHVNSVKLPSLVLQGWGKSSACGVLGRAREFSEAAFIGVAGVGQEQCMWGVGACT